jgi:hypothetical protein
LTNKISSSGVFVRPSDEDTRQITLAIRHGDHSRIPDEKTDISCFVSNVSAWTKTGGEQGSGRGVTQYL